MTTDAVTRLTLRPLPPGAALLAIACALVTLALAAYALRRVPPGRRAVLLGLRALGLACALALVFQPALRSERRATRPSRVVVLLDGSASMALPRTTGGEARIARAAALAADAGALADPAVGRTVEVFRFGGEHGEAQVAVPAEALRSLQASGPHTDLIGALRAMPREHERDLAAVVLVSDGADHGPTASALDDDARAALRALDAPVHTVTVGEEAVRDAVVRAVAHDDFAFVRTPIAFDVPIDVLGAAAAGWTGKAVPLTLRRDGVVLETQAVSLVPGRQHVSLRHVPDRIGEFVFDVSIPALPGELTAENNVARFSLRVVRDRVRVLQVCGRPSWDERFLRSLFKRDPNIDLVSFFILRTPASITVGTQDELSLIRFPTDELFRDSLHTFDLVVMQNFDYGPYDMAGYLPYIRRYVEGGGALAMLGGELSFSGGGYAGTPIEELLPVELDPADRADKTRATTIDARPVSPKLTAAGRAHPLTALALDVEESARVFGALPPLDGVNLVRRARPDAEVLAVHPTLLDADHKPLPIISVREAGRGRVLAVGSDSTWRWSFEGEAKGARRPYERFWESAIRWLVRDPSLSLVRLELDRAVLDARGVLPVRVSVVGPDYRPVKGAQVSFELARVPDLDGTPAAAAPAVAAGETGEGGSLERTIEALPKGAYRLRARATLGGREATDEEVFLVEAGAAELEDPAARPKRMAELAAATGGETRSDAEGVKGLPTRPPREVRIAASEDRPLWTSPLLLLLAVAAFSAAWGLGRRWGRR